MRSLIAIPTYNERDNIVGLIEDIVRIVPMTDILIIDDNSPDGTGDAVEALRERLPQVRVLHRPGKMGLGTAYVKGFEYAIEQGYDLVFEMDADYSHDPRALPDFFRMANDAELVIGSRYIPGGSMPNWSALRRFISGGGNIFARMLLGIPTRDCTSGFRCYRTSALRTLDLSLIRAQGYAFQVELAYVFWKRGMRVREVPITFVDRRIGKSKMSRKIFIEGFVWVLRTRLRGDPVASAVRVSAADTAAPSLESPQDSPSPSAASQRQR